MLRDDANNMTRDDVLRELELLPAWKLRAPIQIIQLEKVQVENLEVKNLDTLSVKKPNNTVVMEYEITVSPDKHWAFLCIPANSIDATSQGMLLNNILQALHIENPVKTLANSTDAKIIVAFGENVAQALLSSQQKLDNLRGKLHTIGESKLIATFDLAHLLANPSYKAKLWQDLCLARQQIQSLQTKE